MVLVQSSTQTLEFSVPKYNPTFQLQLYMLRERLAEEAKAKQQTNELLETMSKAGLIQR